MSKRIMVATALLALVAATSVLAGAPPSVWFEDNFDSYGAGKLADKSPKWGNPQVIEPGRSSAWGGGTIDVNVASGGKGACGGSYFVVMQGYQGNWGSRSLPDPAAAAAETQRPPNYSPGVGWDTQAAGQVQILHFSMKRAYDELADPPLHAGIYLMDNNAFGAQPIMGWAMSAHAIKPQLNLPAYAGPNWYTNRYHSPEGAVWALPGAGTQPPWPEPGPAEPCHAFTAVYDPATGDVKFYVDEISETTPLWTGNAGPGRVSRSLYVRDYGWHGGSLSDVVYLDSISVGTTARPVLSAPKGGAFEQTATPTISWTHAALPGSPTQYRVKVCTTDDPNGTAVYDSGVIAGSATSKITSALPTNTHLWAFVNECYTNWTGWSLQGNGGFYCVTSAPSTPTVVSPTGTVIGARPSVVFSGGVLHSQFEVKVATDAAGSSVVWTSGTVDSLKNGASCPDPLILLAPGTHYYAFARAMNPVGPSAWSPASAFQVTRVGEGTDFRGMEETYVGGTRACWEEGAGTNAFSTYCGGGMSWASVRVRVLPDPFNRFPDLSGRLANYQPCDWWPANAGEEDGVMLRDQKGHYIIPPIPDRAAPSYILDIWDTGANWNDNFIALHSVPGIDLDKGVTFATLASGHTFEGVGGGGHNARQIAQEAQIYIMDDYGDGKCMASFRYGQGEVGICANAVSWVEGYFDDDQHYPDPRPGQGWHLVRITGRNRVVGDPTTTEWKYYLDEDPTPLITATGSMDQSIAPYGAIVDAIAIGQGDGGMVGNWQYDWTSVNLSGDYAPGQWAPISRTYATISAAAAESEAVAATITGEAVITVVGNIGVGQQGFWVQDVDTKDYSNVFIQTDLTANVEVGHKVTGISGTLSRMAGVGNVLTGAFTVTTTHAEARPMGLAQRSLASRQLSEYPYGTDTTGKFVRICGTITGITASEDFLPVIYIDDGSALTDGREIGGVPGARGVRIVIPDYGFTCEIGDYYRVDGIAGWEMWDEFPFGEDMRYVRTLRCATPALIADR